jgi:hypothetical protein
MRSRRVHVVGDGPRTRLRLSGDWEHDPLSSLGDAARLSAAVDKLQHDLVTRARSHGCSWTSIGQALGTTRQAAWERFSGER